MLKKGDCLTDEQFIRYFFNDPFCGEEREKKNEYGAYICGRYPNHKGKHISARCDGILNCDPW
jgi:hypothetical protein